MWKNWKLFYNQACLRNCRTRVTGFLVLTVARSDGSYSKLLKAIARLDLLIIDDWRPEPLTAATRNDLMEIIDNRYEQSATVIISQLLTEQWYQAIGDNTLADASPIG